MKRGTVCLLCMALFFSGCGKSGDRPFAEGERRTEMPVSETPVVSPGILPSPTEAQRPVETPSPTLTPIPDGKLLGWLLVEERRHVDGEDTTEQRTYDENNRLIKVESYRCDVSGDVFLGGEEYAYDEQGNCILQATIDEYKNRSMEKSRYEDGRLVEKQFCEADGTPYLTELYIALEDGSIRYEERREDNTLRYYSLIRYDAAGNVIENCSFLEDGTCRTTYKAEYREFGILSSYEEDFDIYEEGEGPVYRATDYSYDLTGNLIKKKATTGFLDYDDWWCEEEEYRYESGKLVYKSFRETISGDDTVLLEEEAYRYDREEQIYAASWYNGALQSQEEWRCVFDENGRLSEKILLKEDGTDSVRRKTYRYDDYGNCIEIVDQQGKRRDRYTYVYEPIFERTVGGESN
ncbi:MAG: hypothetical protein Q4C48_04235 [Lachnospiraceae bacterium]|nr:hypothetical protein [Lachnospiraceae bacterium]